MQILQNYSHEKNRMGFALHDGSQKQLKHSLSSTWTVSSATGERTRTVILQTLMYSICPHIQLAEAHTLHHSAPCVSEGEDDEQTESMAAGVSSVRSSER